MSRRIFCVDFIRNTKIIRSLFLTQLQINQIQCAVYVLRVLELIRQAFLVVIYYLWTRASNERLLEDAVELLIRRPLRIQHPDVLDALTVVRESLIGVVGVRERLAAVFVLAEIIDDLILTQVRQKVLLVRHDRVVDL